MIVPGETPPAPAPAPTPTQAPPSPASQVIGYQPLLWLSVAIISAFACVSFYILGIHGITAETRGAIIQAWIGLATMVTGFWFGSTVTSKVQRLKGQ
jgi:hypothetical protein